MSKAQNQSSQPYSTADLGFAVDPERGFLPSSDPLDRLPRDFDRWEEIAGDIPKLLAAETLRPILEQLPVLDVDALHSEAQLRRAMMLLSYFGHGYVWGGKKAVDHVPSGVAVPWHAVAHQLDRPPVLSYASYALDNWRRLDSNGPIALGNIVLLQNFLAGLDEEWFILIHVDIEAKAAPALRAIGSAQRAVSEDRPDELEHQLGLIAAAVQDMYTTLLRMPEQCDPYIYYHRVRPYIHGWKDQPALPHGVVYQGVTAYKGQPQQFRGETGAQSSLIPCLDAALSIGHRDDPLRPYLREMRAYMPARHRDCIAAIEQGPCIRDYVLAQRQQALELRSAYDACVHQIELFRSTHLEYAGRYIHQQIQCRADNPTDRGTGGTPFMPYLKKHRDETAAHLIS